MLRKWRKLNLLKGITSHAVRVLAAEISSPVERSGRSLEMRLCHQTLLNPERGSYGHGKPGKVMEF